MDDRDFFDHLYSVWAKTTGAADQFWMPEECYEGGANLFSVDEKQAKSPLGWVSTEADADFITAVHGCLPDLIRRLHEAIDESDRLDEERDVLVGRIATLETEADEANSYFDSLNAKISKLEGQLEIERANVEYWRSR